jgi:3-phosphoshikimate 1-carboxyvinyltransferase
MQQVIRRPESIGATVRPPGDKSISHRAAIFNAISDGTATISNFSTGDDCNSTIRVLRNLGAKISLEGTELTISGRALHKPTKILDVGNSGTTIRLMAGILAGQTFRSILTGDRSIRSRPMDRIIDPLRLMGATVNKDSDGKYAPLKIEASQLNGILYQMPVASAQIKSAIMLAALFANGQTVIKQPHRSRDHTERMFRAMGAEITEDQLTISVNPGRLTATDIVIPSDISSAAFWLVAGLCHPNAKVKVLGVGVNPDRTGILDALKDMGADLHIENERSQSGEPVADITAHSSILKGIEISGGLIPRLIDEIPILALAACFADGSTTITGASELRVKESDRIKTTISELTKLGARIEELPSGIRITGTGSLTGCVVESHGDHRIAMTMGIAGLLSSQETTVVGARDASISYPNFWDELDAIQAAGGDK